MIEVKVFRRHSKECPHKANRYYRKCKCRVWLEWGPDRKRKAAKTRSWEQGDRIARHMEREFEQAAFGERPSVEAITVERAAKSFLETKAGEGIDKDTLQKLQRMTTLLLDYCRRQNLLLIREVSLPHLTAHPAEWLSVMHQILTPDCNVKALNSRKPYSKLNSFSFRSCSSRSPQSPPQWRCK